MTRLSTYRMPRLTLRARPRGFSMVELLVVAAIVAAIAAMLFVVMGKVYQVIRSWN